MTTRITSKHSKWRNTVSTLHQKRLVAILYPIHLFIVIIIIVKLYVPNKMALINADIKCTGIAVIEMSHARRCGIYSWFHDCCCIFPSYSSRACENCRIKSSQNCANASSKGTDYKRDNYGIITKILL